MNNLRNLRMAKGLSIPELQRLTGYPLRTLEDWDSNKSQITAYHRMRKLADILQVSVDELMCYKQDCMYGENKAILELVQEENGVKFTFTKLYTSNPVSGSISREMALELLRFMKKNKDIEPFFTE